MRGNMRGYIGRLGIWVVSRTKEGLGWEYRLYKGVIGDIGV